MNPDTFRKLAALGLSTDQIAGVLEVMAADKENSNEKARARWHKWNDKLGISRSEWRYRRNAVKDRDGHKCAYCGSTENLHVDHVIPLVGGGSSELDNLVTACRECNCGKSGRTVEEWRGGK